VRHTGWLLGRGGLTCVGAERHPQGPEGAATAHRQAFHPNPNSPKRSDAHRLVLSLRGHGRRLRTLLDERATGINMKDKSVQMPHTRQLARRRLLQLLSVGGLVGAGKLLPKEWVRPVVDEVMLPAHAQLTNGPVPDDASDAGP